MGDYGPVQVRPGPSAAAAVMASPPPLPNPQFAFVPPPDVVEQQLQQRGAGGTARMPPAVSATAATWSNTVRQPQPDVIQGSRPERQPSPLYMNEEEAAAKVEEEQQPTYMNEDQEALRGR